MVFWSKDKYFSLGVQSLANRYLFNTHDLMILDSSHYIYVIDSQWFYQQNFECPIRALLFCNNFLHNRDIPVKVLINIINSKTKNKYFPVKNLTAAELKVINDIYNGRSSKILASLYNRSEKTISTHKTSALHKLGVKNIMMLHQLINFWETVMAELQKDQLKRISDIFNA